MRVIPVSMTNHETVDRPAKEPNALRRRLGLLYGKTSGRQQGEDKESHTGAEWGSCLPSRLGGRGEMEEVERDKRGRRAISAANERSKVSRREDGAELRDGSDDVTVTQLRGPHARREMMLYEERAAESV